MIQKDVFLESETDEWYSRNQVAIKSKILPDKDPKVWRAVSVIQKNQKNHES